MIKFLKKYRDVLTPPERKERRQQIILVIVSGILMGISFPPIPTYFFLFVGLVPYLFVLEKRESLAGISRITYMFGFVFNIITLYWVGSWTPNADKFLKIAGIALMFWNPILFLIPSTLYYFTKKIFNKKIALSLIPVFWVTYEYAYSITDFKFPWLTLGNALPYAQNFIQVADVIGIYGLSLLVLYINITFYLSTKKFTQTRKVGYKSLSAALLLFILPLVYGNIKINNYVPSSEYVKVGLIQPNFDPTDKWAGGSLNEQLETYLQLSRQTISQGAKIIIWPETALPVYLMNNRPPELFDIYNFVDSNKIFLMAGMPDAVFYSDSLEAPRDAKRGRDGKSFYTSYNSILLFSPESREVQRYKKIKLVPFGERVPLVDVLPILGDLIKWNVGISGWNVGKDTTVFKLDYHGITDLINLYAPGQSEIFNKTHNDKSDTLKIAGVVCIESIYPGFISAFVRKGAEFIAVVTNDSWYGDSSGPYQHKEMAVIRAVENRRSVVRAANGGISCLIDPLGRTITETEMFIRDALTVNVPLDKTETFYTKYPLLIPILSSIISVWIIGLFYLKKIQQKFNKSKLGEV